MVDKPPPPHPQLLAPSPGPSPLSAFLLTLFLQVPNLARFEFQHCAYLLIAFKSPVHWVLSLKTDTSNRKSGACLSGFSRAWLFATPWTVALQAPLSMGILQERLMERVVVTPIQGIFLTPGSNPNLLCLLHWLVLYHQRHLGNLAFCLHLEISSCDGPSELVL